MESREAYERRVWRVGLLLTDDSASAEAILAEVVGVQPALEKVGETRLDRMVVQASREEGLAPERGASLGEVVGLDDEAAAVWGAVRDLNPQSREAWVFRELEGLDPIRAAGAMDCSRTAIEEVHLAGACRVLEARLGEGLGAGVESLRAALGRLEESGAMRGALERAAENRERAVGRRRLVSGIRLAVLLGCFAIMVWVLMDLLGWEQRKELDRLQNDGYSNTLPSESAKGGAE